MATENNSAETEKTLTGDEKTIKEYLEASIKGGLRNSRYINKYLTLPRR
jgi:hypothetical protein